MNDAVASYYNDVDDENEEYANSTMDNVMKRRICHSDSLDLNAEADEKKRMTLMCCFFKSAVVFYGEPDEDYDWYSFTEDERKLIMARIWGDLHWLRNYPQEIGRVESYDAKYDGVLASLNLGKLPTACTFLNN